MLNNGSEESDRVLGKDQKKLETQKRGPSGAHWLRVEMPC